MNVSSSSDYFLSCDWGTSAFRLHLVDARLGKSLAAVTEAEGVSAVFQAWRAAKPDADRAIYFLAVVRRQTEKLSAIAGRPLKGLPLVISGMATASIGLREIPHKDIPFHLDGHDLRLEKIAPQPEDFGPVLLVSGARSSDDVMRGEEIQIVGAAALGAERNALFILPGTHSKHVRVQQNRVVGLRTYMTGEFFELLARRSILSNSIDESSAADPAEMAAAFIEGVAAGATENLLHASFGIRVAELSARRSKRGGFHYLSGLVIGTELKELQNDKPKAIVLVGSVALTARYAQALHTLGHRGSISTYPAELAVIAGQSRVAQQAGLLVA
jgi:2-dehydro-3-deoxygalactonokinase